MDDKANSINVVARLIGDNARYGAAVAGGLVLGLVLLFLRDLDRMGFLSGFRQYIVGGLVVYTLGAALIAQVETNLNNHAKAQAKKDGDSFPPFKQIAPEKSKCVVATVQCVETLANAVGYVVMRFVPTLHVVWFILLIVYLSLRACL